MLYLNLVVLLLIGIVSATSSIEPRTDEEYSKICPLVVGSDSVELSSDDQLTKRRCPRRRRQPTPINPNASCPALTTVYELTKQFQEAVIGCDWEKAKALTAPCLRIEYVGLCPDSCCYVSQTMDEWIASYGDCFLKKTQYLTQPPGWSTTLMPNGLIVVQGYQFDTYLSEPPVELKGNVKFFWQRCCEPEGTFKMVAMKMTSLDCLDAILDLEFIGEQPEVCLPECEN